MNRIKYIFCTLLTLSSALSYGMDPLDIYQLDKKEASIPEILLGKKTYLNHDEGAAPLGDVILSDSKRKAAWDALCQLGIAYENTDATQFAQAFTKVECYKNKWTRYEHETCERTWWDTYTTIIYMLHNTFDTKQYAFTHLLDISKQEITPQPLKNTTPTASVEKPQIPTDTNLPTMQPTLTTKLLATIGGVIGKHPLITTFSVTAVIITGSIYCYKKWQSRSNVENDKHINKEHATTDKKIKTDTPEQVKTA